jgi:hypothetical protein
VDVAGKPFHAARRAVQEGDRQIIPADSASALTGHRGQAAKTVVAFGSHCGMNVSRLVNDVVPLGVIGNDAGIGLHSAGAICLSMGDEKGIPAGVDGQRVCRGAGGSGRDVLSGSGVDHVVSGSRSTGRVRGG